MLTGTTGEEHALSFLDDHLQYTLLFPAELDLLLDGENFRCVCRIGIDG